MTRRNCEGALDDPRARPVAHLGIPPALWLPICPFRVLQLPHVRAWIERYARWQRYRMLPNRGGLDDQEERVLQAYDVMDEALRLPLASRAGRR